MICRRCISIGLVQIRARDIDPHHFHTLTIRLESPVNDWETFNKTAAPELSPLLDLQLPGTTWALWSSPTSSPWSSCATPTAGSASSSGAVGPSERPPRLRLRASSLREKWVPDKKINLFWSYQTGHNIASAASGKKKIISKRDNIVTQWVDVSQHSPAN